MCLSAESFALFLSIVSLETESVPGQITVFGSEKSTVWVERASDLWCPVSTEDTPQNG